MILRAMQSRHEAGMSNVRREFGIVVRLDLGHFDGSAAEVMAWMWMVCPEGASLTERQKNDLV